MAASVAGCPLSVVQAVQIVEVVEVVKTVEIVETARSQLKAVPRREVLSSEV